MAVTQKSLENWRSFFRTPDHDIFDIIKGAIIVAAADFPDELKSKRDRITELIYASKRTIAYEKIRSNGSIESNITDQMVNVNQVSSHYGDVTDTSMMKDEVLRIKDVINQSQSNMDLCDSLRKLQQMNLSLEDLQATGIGKSVNVLRKHGSEDVQTLASTLVQCWKDMVNAWDSNNSKATSEEDLLNSKKITENEDHARKLNKVDDTNTPKRHIIRIKIKKTAVQQNTPTSAIKEKPVPHKREVMDYSHETSIEVKLENSKRKLHERYEELEKAKRQRKIQIVEFKDVPKKHYKTNAQTQRPSHRQSLVNRLANIRTTMHK